MAVKGAGSQCSVVPCIVIAGLCGYRKRLGNCHDSKCMIPFDRTTDFEVITLREIKPLRTFDFVKRVIKVLKISILYHIYNTFPRHLLVHQRSPCPTSGQVL